MKVQPTLSGLCVIGSLLLAVPAWAAPWQPQSDQQVLEVLPQRWLAAGERRQLEAAQAAWRAQPRDAERVQALASLYLQRARASSDPRWLGQALALLQPWEGQAQVPVSVRLWRARLAQFDHRFTEAQRELETVLRQQPEHEEALLLQASIFLVQGQHASARSACARLQTPRSLLLGMACMAQHDGLSGQAEAAMQRLLQLRQLPQAGWTEEQNEWLTLMIADLAERLQQGTVLQAEMRRLQERAAQSAAARARVAGWLVARGDNQAVLRLAKAAPQDQALLLYVSQAQLALRQPEAALSVRQLQDRFAAARRRGDAGHEREEAYFALHVLQQPQRALQLAQDNWRQQREPADARLLVAAALKAGQVEVARPVQQWVRSCGLQDRTLNAMLARLEIRS